MKHIRPMTDEEYGHFIQVSLRKKPATVWFRQCRFLNVYTGEIDKAHIHVSGKRIAYVGQQEPLTDEHTEIIDLEPHEIIVPGYIEPHAHPFQWYNPLTWGEYLLEHGTTVSVNDNMFLFSQMNVHQAIQFIEELDRKGHHLWLWWARFDGQTETVEGETNVTDDSLQEWMSHPLVFQGGELTSWPSLLKGNKNLQRWMNMTRRKFGLPIEGHLPGASPETLSAMAATGVSADHEALNGEDVLHRLRLGMYATLRYSSIRPDLPQIIRELRSSSALNVNRVLLTNDGAMPFFLPQASMPHMLNTVMQEGIAPVDAYRMVTLNPAVYYGLDQELGGIAPGRLAHINVLSDLYQPSPEHVMVDGTWVVQAKEKTFSVEGAWLQHYFQPSVLLQEVRPEWLQKGKAYIGLQLVNEVITKPYEFDPQEPLAADECYITLLDQQGQWIINTRVKGYGTVQLKALASTYTASMDYILIGRDHQEMITGLQQALSMGGGIVASFRDNDYFEIALPLGGGMSERPMEDLYDKSRQFVTQLQEHGHPYEDPIYTLLFFSATHLPFIRLTKDGLYAVKEGQIVIPTEKLTSSV